jgi:hypothetical protein
MALKVLPEGFVADDREEAFTLGQAQNVPQPIFQLGSIDAVSRWAFGQVGFIHVAEMNGVVDPLLVLPGRSQPGSQSFDAGFGASHGQQQNLFLVKSDGVTTELEPRRTRSASSANAVNLKVERTNG